MKSLTEIIDGVYAKYPNFDYFNPKDYKKYFPKMSESEINANAELVQSYTEKLMAYEVATTFAKEGDGIVEVKQKIKKGAKLNTWVTQAWKFITQCETWYYVGHLRMNYDGMCAAKE